jgi:hypothetical protein
VVWVAGETVKTEGWWAGGGVWGGGGGGGGLVSLCPAFELKNGPVA